MIRFLESGNGFCEVDGWKPYCWINVENPSAEDFLTLRRDFNVPIDYLEYVADTDERPRVEREGEWMLTILRVPVRSEDPGIPFTTIPLGILVCGEIIITINRHFSEMIPDFIKHTRAKGIRIVNPATFIVRLIFSASVWFLKYLAEINSMINDATMKLEKGVRNDDIIMLMKIQRSLVLFSTSINGDMQIISRLRGIFGGDIDPELLEDVEIEINQAANSSTIYSDILNGTMDAFGSVISNNVNEVMKRMTAVSIVLMVPTLIASFYGMNVDISIAVYKGAFWIIIGIAVVMTALCILLFRRIRWI